MPLTIYQGMACCACNHVAQVFFSSIFLLLLFNAGNITLPNISNTLTLETCPAKPLPHSGAWYYFVRLLHSLRLLRIIQLCRKRGKAELLREDGNLYKIKITAKDNSIATYFIDDKTYLLAKAVKLGDMMGQPVEITISFSDYQTTDFGYVIAHKIDTDMGGNFSFSATVNKVEINKEIDSKIFDIPN